MDKIAELARMLVKSPKTVVFTGAGMSTASGLPDFRSENGLWKGIDPTQLASVEAMERGGEEFFSFYRSRIEALDRVEPNRGHHVLASWEERGLISGIITQNVDGLHHRAGSRNIAELHGNLREVRCRRCRKVYPNSLFLDSGKCPECGGDLRPCVVLFGEMLPVEELTRSQDMLRECSLFIVLGSSLQVSPANWYPRDAKAAGADLVIVNLRSTPMDELADLHIMAPVEEVLSQVERILSDN
jgi:NAD-dependent deacetylase